MKHYSAERIAELLTYGALADAIAAAFAGGQVHAPDRLHATLGSDPRDVLLVMPAWRDGALGVVKLITVMASNALSGHPTVQGVSLVFDARRGTPLATVDATALTRWRTAATSLLAARHLARAESAVMAMVGSGNVAEHLIRAYCSEYPLREVLIWSRTEGHAQRLAAHVSIPAGIRIAATTDLEAAVRRADIVSCATLARAPLIAGAWIRPGTHVDLVGAFTPQMRESDDQLVRSAEIFVDTRFGALREAGDLVQPLVAGVIAEADIRGDLRDLVTGTIRRSSIAAITVFKSVGHAIEDLAAAELLLAGDAGAVSRET